MTAVYTVTSELFFASSNDLYTQFEYSEDPERVVIDLSQPHIWDPSTVASLDAITTKYERKVRPRGRRASWRPGRPTGSRTAST